MLIPLAVMLEQKAAAAASSADNNRCLVIVLPRLSLVAVTVCLILSLPGFADLLEVIGATAVSPLSKLHVVRTSYTNWIFFGSYCPHKGGKRYQNIAFKNRFFFLSEATTRPLNAGEIVSNDV